MPRHKRAKSLSSKARRLRKLKSNAAKVTISAGHIPGRRKWRKKEEHAFLPGESMPDPGRVILSLACVLQIANAAVSHAVGCVSKYKGVKLLNGNEMKEKLIKFFHEDVAPEIVHPRYTKGLPIRQPTYRKEAAEQVKVRKERVKKARMENVTIDFC